MRCPRCQHENRPQAKFCEECACPLNVASPTARSDADPASEVESLRRALTEALEQQTATGEILRAISASPTDTQPVFETIAQHAVRIYDGRDCLVFRFDGTLVDIVAEREMSPEALRELRRIYPVPLEADTMGARSIRERAVVHSPDMLSDPDISEPLRQVARIGGYRSIRMAEALDHPFSLAEACLGIVYVHIVRGDLNPAVRLAERAVALCREWNLTLLANGMASLGQVYAGLGRVEQGLPWLQQALAGHDSAGIGYFHAVSLVQAAEAYLLTGHVEDARACASLALTLTRERGERGHEAWALRVLGEVAFHHENPDAATAEAHYRGAMTLAEELGMRPRLAHCHLGLGTLYRRTGDQAKAEEHLASATAMYREMGMTFWLEKAEGALKEAG